MTLFIYDHTFDGILSCIFYAYEHKTFPDAILSDADQRPLFIDEWHHIETDEKKSQRVWTALERKLSKSAQNMVLLVWLSELPETEMLLFGYFRKIIDNQHGFEMNFGDSDVLRVKEIAWKVNGEAEKIRQFVRFQKTKDGIFFAPISAQYNVLALVAPHFQSRYPDQPWIIYDTARNFGLYYDTHSLQEVTFSLQDLKSFKSRKLENEKLSETEIYYEDLWKEYFETIAIKERFNPKLQRQHMPKRFWKYLTEMQ